MNMKPIEKWEFEELVDFCAGEMMKSLLEGKFRSGVYMALDLALRWDKDQNKKPSKKKKP